MEILHQHTADIITLGTNEPLFRKQLKSKNADKIINVVLEEVKEIMWEGSKMRTASDFIEEFKERLDKLLN